MDNIIFNIKVKIPLALGKFIIKAEIIYNMVRKSYLPAKAKAWKVEIDGKEAFLGDKESAERFAEEEAERRKISIIRLIPIRAERRF